MRCHACHHARNDDDRLHGRRLLGEPRPRRLGLGRARRSVRAAGPSRTRPTSAWRSTAATEALYAIDGPVTVVSDSTYVVNCFTKKWYVGWKAKGWKNSKKQDVANQDLWRPLIDHVLERGDVTWQWVKGHSGDEWNDVVDRLAVEAAVQQKGRSGDRPPEVLGPADAVGLAAAAPPSRTRRRLRRRRSGPANQPEGHLVVVLGHRPPELGRLRPQPPAGRRPAPPGRHPGGAGQARRGPRAWSPACSSGPSSWRPRPRRSAASRTWPCSRSPIPTPSGRPAPGRPTGASWPAPARSCCCRRRRSDSPGDVRRAMGQRDAWLARVADAAIVVWDGQDALAGQGRQVTREAGRRRGLDHRPRRARLGARRFAQWKWRARRVAWAALISAMRLAAELLGLRGVRPGGRGGRAWPAGGGRW